MRRIRTLALAVTFAAALVACGSGGGDHAATGRIDTAPLAAVRNAAQTTTDAKTARLALTVTTGGTGGDVTIDATGVTDYANGTADITLDLGGLAKELPSGVLGSGDLTFEERLIGDTVYIKLPSVLSDLRGPAGKPWTKLDASKLLGGSGGTGFQGTDPSQALTYLNGVSDDVQKVGTETVRGVETTHYTATLDLKKALAQAQGQSGEAKELLDRAIGQLGTSTFPADIWIDGQGRLVKLTYAITVPAAGQKVTANYSMELYDFGTPVDVQAPPADQVGDLGSSLWGALTGGSTTGTT